MIGINIAGAEFGEIGGPHGGWPDNGIPGYIWPSLDVLKAYARNGVKLARVPFKWERMQAAPMGALVATELALLKACLADAATAGVKIIPDCHNYGRHKGLIARPEWLADLWRQLATEIKGSPALEAYDIQNEPHDMGGVNVWRDIASATVTAIRTVDSTTKIHIAGDGWSGAWRWHEVSTNLLPLLRSGPGLVAHAHQYLDPDGSGTYPSTAFGTTSLDIGVTRLKPFVDWCKANGVEGFVGEFGVPGQHDAKWLDAQKRMLDYMVANKIGGTAWAGGAWWGDYVIGLGNVGMPNANMEQLMTYFAEPLAAPAPAPAPALDFKASQFKLMESVVTMSKSAMSRTALSAAMVQLRDSFR